MGKRMDPKTVLACAQKLYEAGLISYPRTGTEYLFPTEKEKVKGILKSYPECAFRDSSGDGVPLPDGEGEGEGHTEELS